MSEQGVRWLAAWLPNLLFAGLGVWLYLRAPK
jgi:lipopolysaccharide export LptBFGC system permease protein LptF